MTFRLFPNGLSHDIRRDPSARVISRLGEQVGHEAAMVFVHRQMAADRGEGALLAIGAFTDAAAYADRHGGVGVADVQSR
jgi:hypothetical protein